MWRQECHAINSRVYALLFTNATYNNYTPHTNTTHEHAYTVRIQDCSNQHLYTWNSSTLNNNTADLVNTFKSGLKSDFAVKRTSAHGWQNAELSMGWVDPWVDLGRDSSDFGGLGWVHYRKCTKNLKKNMLVHVKHGYVRFVCTKQLNFIYGRSDQYRKPIRRGIVRIKIRHY